MYNRVRANLDHGNKTCFMWQTILNLIISTISSSSYYHISLFSQNMLKIHKHKMLRGKIAKRPQEARKGLSPNLGKIHLIYQQKKATNRNKINLHYPSPPNPPWNDINITTAHHYQPCRTHPIHTPTETKNIKISSQAPRIIKHYIITLLRRKYVVLQYCFLNVLTLRDNLISFGKEFQKPGPDVFTPLDTKFVLFFLRL